MSARAFVFNVVTPSSTVLAQNAALMSARSWRQVSPVPTGLVDALTDIYSNRTILSYFNEGHWNGVEGKIEIIGNDHGSPNFKHARYDAATNAFSHSRILEFPGAHNFGLFDVDPSTGESWYRQYSDASIPVWKRSATGTWARVNNITGPYAITGPTWWWSGSAFADQTSPTGFFMVHDANYPGGTLRVYKPDGSLVKTITPVSPWRTLGGYLGVGAYSSTYNCAIWGGTFNYGTNAQLTDICRVNADGTTTRLADMPAGMRFGAWPIGGITGQLVTDPVSGKFLCLSNGYWWEMDPTVGTWTQITTPSSIPTSPYGVNGAFVGLASIPAHGVIAAFHCQNTFGSFWLYKHG